MSASAKGRSKAPSMAGGAPQKSMLRSTFQHTKSSMMVGSTRSQVAGSTSKKSVVLDDGKGGVTQRSKGPNVVVLDDAGNDVTPQPLLIVDPNAPHHSGSKLFGQGGADSSSVGTPTDFMSQASIYQTGTGTASVFGAPFSRSVMGSVSRISGQSTATDQSFGDEISEAGHDLAAGLSSVKTRREEVREILTEADLDCSVPIRLTESDTIWILDLVGTCVANDSENADAIRARNDKYKELCKNRVGNDRYMERGMQTFNDAPKNKEVQADKVELIDTGINASEWDMHDTYQDLAAKDKEKSGEGDADQDLTISRPTSRKADLEEVSVEGSMRQGSALSGQSGRESRASMMGSSVQVSQFEMAETPAPQAPPETDGTVMDDADHPILKTESLQHDLFVMERVVVQNIFQPKQAAYRGMDELTDVDREVPEDPPPTAGSVSITQMGPNLERLWIYHCELTDGRNVSCLSWNKANPDLIAVGYGQFGFNDQKGGLACCWSLKNPKYPERVYHCASGVVSMDFSYQNPSLLAVGLYDGTVAIYNVRSQEDSPVLDSFQSGQDHVKNSENSGKHSAPVWQLKWVERDRGAHGDERGEVLVSVSADGRVVQWSIRKGLEASDLMKLKRTAAKPTGAAKGKEGSKKSEGLIFRFAPGLCFDFSAKDPNIYLAGTEEGHIHKCSCSYNEQYLDSYAGHTGPVYKITWSPFAPDIFLSCSADWSVRLWSHDMTSPAINFFSSTRSVYDVCWSPASSTVFGCVNEGAVEIWDLSVSTLDPIIVNVPNPGIKLSCIAFALNSDCVLVGASDGQVTVYKLKCMQPTPDNQGAALRDIIKATMASQLQSTGKAGKKKGSGE
ncbi:dynein axonemal intermediate chain 4-like isoform X1 [Branchiostoma floridae x Branchiostoma japonicum]